MTEVGIIAIIVLAFIGGAIAGFLFHEATDAKFGGDVSNKWEAKEWR